MIKEVHSPYSPSQLQRISLCPASVKASEDAPEEVESEYAVMGTLKHKMIALLIAGESVETEDVKTIGNEGTEQIQYCLDYAEPFINTAHEVRIEVKGSLGYLGLPEVSGTADLVLICDGVLHVIDWKFGAGIQVYAKDNMQLQAYALIALQDVPNIAKIITHIVQPALDHIDKAEYTPDALGEWFYAWCMPTVEDAQTAKPHFAPGIEQCRWCKAKTVCRARLFFGQKAAVKVFEGYKQKNIDNATKQELSELLLQAKTLKVYIADIEKYAYVELYAGRGFPAFKLVQGRSSRKWKDENEAALWLSAHTDIKETVVSKTISPAQAEKQNTKLKKNKEFNALYNKFAGKAVLTLAKDKRKEVLPAVAAFKDFI